MFYQRQWFIILLCGGLCFTGGWIILNQHPAPAPSSKSGIKTAPATPISTPARQPDTAVLSKEADYPSPVIQLQQTLTADLLKDEDQATTAASPKLKQKLAALSQDHLSQNHTPPSGKPPQALADLKRRLQQLQAITTRPVTPEHTAR